MGRVCRCDRMWSVDQKIDSLATKLGFHNSSFNCFLFRVWDIPVQIGDNLWTGWQKTSWGPVGSLGKNQYIIFVTILSQQISRTWVDGEQTKTPLGGVCSSPAGDPPQPVCHCMQVGCLRIVSENTRSLDLPRGDFAHGIFRSDPSSIVCGFLGGTVARWTNKQFAHS